VFAIGRFGTLSQAATGCQISSGGDGVWLTTAETAPRAPARMALPAPDSRAPLAQAACTSTGTRENDGPTARACIGFWCVQRCHEVACPQAPKVQMLRLSGWCSSSSPLGPGCWRWQRRIYGAAGACGRSSIFQKRQSPSTMTMNGLYEVSGLPLSLPKQCLGSCLSHPLCSLFKLSSHP
jgi:hypothetical protein